MDGAWRHVVAGFHADAVAGRAVTAQVLWATPWRQHRHVALKRPGDRVRVRGPIGLEGFLATPVSADQPAAPVRVEVSLEISEQTVVTLTDLTVAPMRGPGGGSSSAEDRFDSLGYGDTFLLGVALGGEQASAAAVSFSRLPGVELPMALAELIRPWLS
jgi:hypothetical protein